jgi:UDP-N-acetyl-D-mannosaminuronic acid dehydrogenase|tara:strand:- start:223 stop:1401 length:1179 start_codon:yes stop_codon:yes gene_type:complete
MPIKINNKKISIIGGAGHVGFPLGIVFASKGFKVHLVDKNKDFLTDIKNGIPPFLEKGAKKILKKVLKEKKVFTNLDYEPVTTSKFIVICIGTPIDSNLKPKIKEFLNFFYLLKKLINKSQIIIIRSSIFPGVFNKVCKILKNSNVVYCPERIVQGKSIEELPRLPQIIAGNNNKSIYLTKKLFKKIATKIIITTVLEAELVKLFSNANRYVNFSIANQLYMICKENKLNFSRVRNIMRDGYERNLNLPTAGFTAGPCLLKDTMQLSSFYKNKFSLGHTAMHINENIPKFLIDDLKKKYNLKKKSIGILGLAFKAETDDIRDSLAIKLVKYLKKNKLKVFQSDEYYKNQFTVKKELLIKKSDIIIIAAPHENYKKIKFPKKKIVVDIWGIKK